MSKYIVLCIRCTTHTTHAHAICQEFLKNHFLGNLHFFYKKVSANNKNILHNAIISYKVFLTLHTKYCKIIKIMQIYNKLLIIQILVMSLVIMILTKI